MNNTPATASAPLDKDLVKDLLEQSRFKALERAGKTEAQVRDVQDIQRKEMQKLLYGNAKGTEGESAQGAMEMPTLQPELEQAIKKDDRERMEAINETPDAYVFKREDTAVGVQHDDDRSVGLADEILRDPKQARNVSKHEGAHRKQEIGDQVATLPETGNPKIDKHRQDFRRLIFREDHAIAAEGGLKNHTSEYRGFVDTAQATEEHLNAVGMEGKKLREDAAKSTEGFRTLQEALLMASFRHRMRSLRSAETSMN